MTGGGRLMPMSTLIRLASRSIHYLAIFHDATAKPLYPGEASGWPAPTNVWSRLPGTRAARIQDARHLVIGCTSTT